MTNKKRTTSDAVKILRRRYYEGKPARIAQLDNQRSGDEVARKIFVLRESAGLTQKSLAERVGTTASVICRLENADYEGHSLTMLNRVAAALNQKVEIRFVPLKGKLQAA